LTDFRSRTLFVIRHGECEHNAARIAAGHGDTPLTPRGRAQAARSGKTIAELADTLAPLDFVASPLHRACVTMELLRESAGIHPTQYRTDRRLMEGDLGELTLTPVTDLIRREGEVEDPWNHRPGGGESYAMIHERVAKFLQTLQRDAVLVTHMLPALMIRAHYLGLTPQQTIGYQMGNAAILRLTAGSEAYFGD
jgi:probable phosphoglycerate mutase